MLGVRLHDRDGLDGQAASVDGLGLLDVETVMSPSKFLTRARATHAASGVAFDGYEIQYRGNSRGRYRAAICQDRRRAGWCRGAVSADGRVSGTYLHGLFSDDAFRAAWLNARGIAASGTQYGADVDRVLDDLAAHLEAHVKIDELFAAAGEV